MVAKIFQKCVQELNSKIRENSPPTKCRNKWEDMQCEKEKLTCMKAQTIRYKIPVIHIPGRKNRKIIIKQITQTSGSLMSENYNEQVFTNKWDSEWCHFFILFCFGSIRFQIGFLVGNSHTNENGKTLNTWFLSPILSLGIIYLRTFWSPWGGGMSNIHNYQ